MDQELVIGIVFKAGTLTTATRRARQFGAIRQQTANDGEALAAIFGLANVHRHDRPMFHLAGEDVPRIVDSIRRGGITCEVFNWVAPVNDSFANLGSRQFSELREQVTAGLRTGIADDALTHELDAFTRDETSGQVRFPSPEALALALGHYPARALATLLANQFAGPISAQYRPLARGYVPMRPTTGGHDPMNYER